MSVRVGMIGTGDPDGRGAAMAYNHAAAYEAIDGCDLIACADLVRENAEAFAAEYGIPDERTYADYEAMLTELSPDIVSVCTPVPTHEEIVVGAAETGAVGAIHCEKPMADTWGGARRMARVCQRRAVQLTINHQRRMGIPWRRAKEHLEAGEIGCLERIETATGPLLDSGTHRIDACNYFVDETPAEWVLGNIDYREENIKFGTHNENQSLARWEYSNGVTAVTIGGSFTRLCGTDGMIDISRATDPPVRVREHGEASWRPIACEGEGIHGSGHIRRAIQEVVTAYQTGRTSELGAQNALRATEIIFAIYESARRTGRVDLPLDVDDNPLEAMVASGRLQPEQGG